MGGGGAQAHRGKNDKERGKEGAVIANRRKDVGVSNKSAKKYGLLPSIFSTEEVLTPSHRNWGHGTEGSHIYT